MGTAVHLLVLVVLLLTLLCARGIERFLTRLFLLFIVNDLLQRLAPVPLRIRYIVMPPPPRKATAAPVLSVCLTPRLPRSLVGRLPSLPAYTAPAPTPAPTLRELKLDIATVYATLPRLKRDLFWFMLKWACSKVIRDVTRVEKKVHTCGRRHPGAGQHTCKHGVKCKPKATKANPNPPPRRPKGKAKGKPTPQPLDPVLVVAGLEDMYLFLVAIERARHEAAARAQRDRRAGRGVFDVRAGESSSGRIRR